MLSSLLDKLYQGDVPNNFTEGMGELIRQARIESKMSQSDLAEKAHFRQAAISQIETGKREVSATDLLMLSYSLNKPIIYFFPKRYVHEIYDDNILTPLEEELLMQVRRLDDNDLRRMIVQTRALADLSEM